MREALLPVLYPIDNVLAVESPNHGPFARLLRRLCALAAGPAICAMTVVAGPQPASLGIQRKSAGLG